MLLFDVCLSLVMLLCAGGVICRAVRVVVGCWRCCRSLLVLFGVCVIVSVVLVCCLMLLMRWLLFVPVVGVDWCSLFAVRCRCWCWCCCCLLVALMWYAVIAVHVYCC